MDHQAFGVFMFYAAAGLVAVDRAGRCDRPARGIREKRVRVPQARADDPVPEGGRLRPDRALRESLRRAPARRSQFPEPTEFPPARRTRRDPDGARRRSRAIPSRRTTVRFATCWIPSFRDRYHLVRAKAGIDVKNEAGLIRLQSRYRAEGLFPIASFCRKNGDEAGMRAAMEALGTVEKQPGSLDYAVWFERLVAGDDVAYKDHADRRSPAVCGTDVRPVASAPRDRPGRIDPREAEALQGRPPVCDQGAGGSSARSPRRSPARCPTNCRKTRNQRSNERMIRRAIAR
ncbi:MAG: hypothetical protein MZU97_09755 [Bacillus subtilis]|nr:hypothetical protein [Bacillus subtilis]